MEKILLRRQTIADRLCAEKRMKPPNAQTLTKQKICMCNQCEISYFRALKRMHILKLYVCVCICNGIPICIFLHYFFVIFLFRKIASSANTFSFFLISQVDSGWISLNRFEDDNSIILDDSENTINEVRFIEKKIRHL